MQPLCLQACVSKELKNRFQTLCPGQSLLTPHPDTKLSCPPCLRRRHLPPAWGLSRLCLHPLGGWTWRLSERKEEGSARRRPHGLAELPPGDRLPARHADKQGPNDPPRLLRDGSYSLHANPPSRGWAHSPGRESHPPGGIWLEPLFLSSCHLQERCLIT